MSNEEKKNELSANLAAALNPAKIENPANIDPVTRQEIQKKSLSELKVEIKFHLGQMAGHAVEIGKLLIEAKEQVGHGEWGNWLAENFNLKRQSAQNFMNIANRFGGNYQSIGNLGTTQMIAMLALPAGEEENFIAEKAAGGTPVEDMTVKNLKAEIADYKKRLAQAEQDAELENLGEENQRLREGREEDGKRIGGFIEENLNLKEDNQELQDKIDDLENALLQKESSTVEVAPADYEPTKKKLAEIEAENEKLQAKLKNLQERPIEVATEYPADYASVKAENAELKNAQKTFMDNYRVEKEVLKMLSAVPVLLNYVNLQQVVANLAAKNPQVIKERIQQLSVIQTELTNYYEIWESNNGAIRLEKLDYDLFQDYVEKISNGQRDFIPTAQAKARELLKKEIPESVFTADNSYRAFDIWLGREINPIINTNGYKQRIFVFGDDEYAWGDV